MAYQEAYTPRYIELHRSGELARRAAQAVAELKDCRACPWECGVNRLEGEEKVCRLGRYARVASYFAHQGEEDCLRGWFGSGAIFFASCNLRCVFCQNYDISQKPAGAEVGPERLAEMMLELQERGCHNINWVTPEHVAPQLLEAMPLAVEGGLHIPIVYNTSAFDALRTLRLLDGIVDIYMPDFKYWDPKKAKRYLKTAAYPAAARAAIREMHRQVGDLAIDEQGIARRGLLVRHLVMPGALEDTASIMLFLAHKVSAHTYVNILGQYFPAGKVSGEKFPEINRGVTGKELEMAYALARQAGLYRFDQRVPRRQMMAL